MVTVESVLMISPQTVSGNPPCKFFIYIRIGGVCT